MQLWSRDFTDIQVAKEGLGQNRVTLTVGPPTPQNPFPPGVNIDENSLVVASVTEIVRSPTGELVPILGAATNIHLNSVVPQRGNSIEISLFNDFTAFPINYRIYLITGP
jgi:hypothetical protein